MGANASSEGRRSSAASPSGSGRASSSSGAARSPQIRCYHCHGIFTTALPGAMHRVQCPYCSTVNGVPAQGGGGSSSGAGSSSSGARSGSMGALAAAMSSVADLSTANQQERQEHLLRRLQSREITPLELLILREFVEHLQQNRPGASMRDIDGHTASWVVDDVMKLPEELRTCSVCLEEVEKGQGVRTLPCLHTFHKDCAEEWLKKKKVRRRRPAAASPLSAPPPRRRPPPSVRALTPALRALRPRRSAPSANSQSTAPQSPTNREPPATPRRRPPPPPTTRHDEAVPVASSVRMYAPLRRQMI